MTRIGILVLALGCALAAPAAAQQRAEITAFGGWQFGGRAYVRNGEIKLNDAFNYGAIIDIRVRHNAQVELYYSRQETKLKLDESFGVSRELTDLAVQYFHAGGLMELQRGMPAIPFVSFTLGATHYNPKEKVIDERSVDDEWRFSMILGLGVKYFPGERIGLRLQGHLTSTFLDTGGSLWCGPGGCSFGLFGWGVYQGEVSAGLTLAI